MKIIVPTVMLVEKKRKNKIEKVYLNKNIEGNLNRFVYNKLKEDFVEIVRAAIPEGFKIETPCHLHYTYFHRSHHIGDLDNATGIIKKFIQDALVKLGYLEEDNWTKIPSSSEKFGGYDLENPRCEIEFTLIPDLEQASLLPPVKSPKKRSSKPKNLKVQCLGPLFAQG